MNGTHLEIVTKPVEEDLDPEPDLLLLPLPMEDDHAAQLLNLNLAMFFLAQLTAY